MMSNPGYLTTSREGENRRASPSSARIVTAVSSPTPNWPMSALQPIDGTHMRAVLCRADQLSVERVIIRRASVTCSRSLTGNARALRHRPPVPSSGCTVVGSLGNRAPPRSAAATRRADARVCAATAPESAYRGCAPAGSTTPASDRASTTLVCAEQPRGRSWHASYSRAWPPSRPTQLGAPPRQPAGTPLIAGAPLRGRRRDPTRRPSPDSVSIHAQVIAARH